MWTLRLPCKVRRWRTVRRAWQKKMPRQHRRQPYLSTMFALTTRSSARSRRLYLSTMFALATLSSARRRQPYLSTMFARAMRSNPFRRHHCPSTTTAPAKHPRRPRHPSSIHGRRLCCPRTTCLAARPAGLKIFLLSCRHSCLKSRGHLAQPSRLLRKKSTTTSRRRRRPRHRRNSSLRKIPPATSPWQRHRPRSHRHLRNSSLRKIPPATTPWQRHRPRSYGHPPSPRFQSL